MYAIFLAGLFLFNLCHGGEEYTYLQEDITYAGMTIKCVDGCGTYDDPDMKEIWSILEKTLSKTFNNVFALDTTGDAILLSSPVRCNDTGDCERWNWQSTNGVWPSDKNLTRYLSIYNYPTFLEAANMLREDIDFYYFIVPRKVGNFETNLVAKLEEALKQGYNAYRIFPNGDVEFSYQENPLYASLSVGWERIEFQLSYLSHYGFRHKKSISIQNREYKNAKDLIEQAIAEIDALFRDLFVYCLKHHQPEGIAFSTAIEALLVGNLTEGIEHIQALIEIGESKQFHPDLMGKMHLLKGQLEIESNLYAEAILSLTEAIAKNQSLKEAYLERATAYFELGKYDLSVEDYLAYSEQHQEEGSFSTASFSWAFAKNLPSGAYESGKGLGLFLSDLVTDPIHTAKQVWESLSLLGKLATTKEWEKLSKALVPEIHQLIIEWDVLSSEKRGELAGYAFGKYGADLIIPGALSKAISRGLKCKAEVSTAYKGLRAADQTLLLESTAGCENTAKFAEAINLAQTTVFLGEELGFTAKEMGRLKQAGKLEATLQNKFHHLSLLKQESINLFGEAETFLRGHKGFRPEHEVRNLIHQTGIPTFTRPKGVPENYRVKLSDNGAGMKYVHPRDEGTYVRIMPGKAHSNNPCQQKPYVNHRINGRSVDKFGKFVSSNKSKEAHIPLEEFVYRNNGSL